MIANSPQQPWARYGEIIGCVIVGSLRILLLDALTLLYTVYSDDTPADQGRVVDPRSG
jgi:hypothetical protein